MASAVHSGHRGGHRAPAVTDAASPAPASRGTQRRKGKGAAQEDEGAVKKDKLRTSKDVYDRLVWNPSGRDLTRVRIGYLDRISGMVEMPLLSWVPTQQDGDIPWHRVHYFRMDDELLWDRESRVDVIFGSGDSGKGTLPLRFSAHPSYSQAVANTESMNDHRPSTGRPRDGAAARRDAGPSTLSTEMPSFEFDAVASQWVARDSGTSPYTPAHAGVGTQLRHLRVVSFNVLFDIHDEEAVYSEQRYPAAFEMLRAADADVLCLVEVTPKFAALVLAQDWVRAQYFATDGGDGASVAPSYGQLILSRSPFVRAFSIERIPVSRHKDAICGMFRVNGRSLCVVAVHLSSSRNRDASESRAREISSITDALRSNVMPDDCIVTGDFNMSAKEGSLLAADEWVDAWTALHPNEDGFTFDPSENALAAQTSVSGEAARYDRTYVRSSRWHVTAASVTGREPFDAERSLHYSDHYALSVDLEFGSGVLREPVGRAVTSAVVVSPPEAQWGPIQAIRSVHDKSYVRWLPHINLLYPFVKDEGERFAEAASAFSSALADMAPFAVTLGEFAYFAHGRSCTVYLRPNARYIGAVPPGDTRCPLRDLQARLQDEFPECDELARIGSNGFTPHLSVGQFKSAQEAQRHIASWQMTWRPITFEVTSVSLISRTASTPFEVRAVVPIGGGAAPWGSALGRSAPANGAASAETSEKDEDAESAEAMQDVQSEGCATDFTVGIIDAAARAVVATMCPASVRLFEGVRAVGSVQLGVATPASDVDLVCFGPNEIPREAFFAALNAELSKKDRFVLSTRIVRDAIVPVLTVQMRGGLCADVQYARCAKQAVFNDHLSIERLAPKDMRAMDDESQAAAAAWLNGRALLDAAKGSDGTVDAFRALLVLVKRWATTRGLASTAFGFLGGISLAVLASKYCSTCPEKAVAACVRNGDDFRQFVRHFFHFVRSWPWPRPMSVGALGVFQARDDPMPIVTPTAPVRNSARNVTKSSFAVILAELDRAVDATGEGKSEADLVVNGADAFFAEHEEFAVVQVQHVEESERMTCDGWLRGRVASLLAALESAGVSSRAWPAVFVDAHGPSCAYPHSLSVVVGLKGTGNGGVASGALFRFCDQWDWWVGHPAGGRMEAKVIARDNVCVQKASRMARASR